MTNLIMICGWCKHDLEGHEQQNELLRAHDPDAKVSHGICPDCSTKMEKAARASHARRQAEQNNAVDGKLALK